MGCLGGSGAGGFDFSGFDFSDIFGDLFGESGFDFGFGGGRSRGSNRATRGSDRLIRMDLTFEEALEITKIHSISGNIESGGGLITTRPFRRPHHTSSPISIIGGGRNPKPGEVSLAHFGVLFLDELPEFKKSTLEVLRGPIEDRNVLGT